MTFSVVLDTCVLYPAYLRDTLLRLADADLFRPLWSHAILEELQRNLAERMGLNTAEHVLERMEVAFPEAIVTGHDPLIPAMRNHPKDRHVLAAAVRADASAIVTFNESDFPPTETEPFAIDVLHPDAFLLDLIDLDPNVAIEALRAQVAGYRRPHMGLADLARALERCGCPDTAADLLERTGGRTA